VAVHWETLRGNVIAIPTYLKADPFFSSSKECSGVISDSAEKMSAGKL